MSRMEIELNNYIDVDRRLKEVRKESRLLLVERKRLSSLIEDYMIENDIRELNSDDNSVTIRLSERTRKCGPSIDELVENVAESTGVVYDETRLSGLKRDRVCRSIKVCSRKRSRL